MTNTIKLIMIGLFIVAGLVVTRVGLLINRTFHPAMARINAPAPIDYQDLDDFDNDGLSNAEEAVWLSDPYNPDTDGDGYLDGEEVFSDHNPLVAGDDSLAKQRNFLALNSTERLAQVIAGGVLSGDLKQSNNPAVYAQSVDMVAGSTVYSVLSALENVDIPEEVANVVPSTKVAQENYLEAILKVISPGLTDLAITQPKEIVLLFSPDQNAAGTDVFDPQQKERIKTKYLQHAQQFQEAFEELSLAAVPENWKEIHQKIITLLKKLELYHRSIALSIDDPLKQMIVLSNLQSVYLEAQPILAQIDSKIKSQGLTPPDSDFFNISLLLLK